MCLAFNHSEKHLARISVSVARAAPLATPSGQVSHWVAVAGTQGEARIVTETSKLKWGPPSGPPSSTLEDLPSLHRPQGQARETHLLPPALQYPPPTAVSGGGEGRQGAPHDPTPSHLHHSLMPLPHQHKWLKVLVPSQFYSLTWFVEKGQHKYH